MHWRVYWCIAEQGIFSLFSPKHKILERAVSHRELGITTGSTGCLASVDALRGFVFQALCWETGSRLCFLSSRFLVRICARLLPLYYQSVYVSLVTWFVVYIWITFSIVIFQALSVPLSLFSVWVSQGMKAMTHHLQPFSTGMFLCLPVNQKSHLAEVMQPTSPSQHCNSSLLNI